MSHDRHAILRGHQAPHAGLLALEASDVGGPCALGNNRCRSAYPTLMNQIPAYATADDATTGALPANREGSWRRNQLRLEAGVNVPDYKGQI